MEKFRCLPVQEPFCCFTEIITLFPSEIRRFKEVIENFGVLIPSFGGFLRASVVEKAIKGEKYAWVPLTDKVYVYIDLIFVSYKPYKKPISEVFKNFIKRYDLDPPYVCPFLDEDSFRCSIYEQRPISCKRYPAIGYPLFDKEQCLVCSQGKAFCQNCDGLSAEDLLSYYKTEEFKREIKEFHKLIRQAFSYSNVLNEAIKLSKEMDFAPPPPNVTIILHHLTYFLYQTFSLSIEKQISNLERALKYQKGNKAKEELITNLTTLSEVRKVKTLGKKLPKDLIKLKVHNLPLP